VPTSLSTDANEIIALLRPLIAEDPVRLTVLGSVAQVLEEPSAEGWCLAVPGSADIAARSSPVTPVVVVGHWADPDARAELVAALRGLPDLAAINGPLPWSAEIAEQAVPISHRMDQRLFRLDTLVPPTGVPGSARRAGEEDRPLLLDWYRAFAEEAEARSMDLERSVDRMLASGRPLRDVVASLGISRSTYQRWRRRSEGLTGGADRLLELEQENTRLRRIVADRDLEIEMLRELSRGTY